MIDTHLHILPAIDDGPETLEESFALARLLVQEGVRAAIATPHYNDEFPHRSTTEIHARVQELQGALAGAGIPLKLFPGHEVLIRPGLVEDIQTGRVSTLNGTRYLLLELWNTVWLPETERIVFELRAHGLIPIIAHPERYRAIQQDPNRLASLIQLGAIAQLTMSSLIGIQSSPTRRCAETLLKKGLIHCIATDAHGVHKRLPNITEGLRFARNIVGSERIHHMTEIQPAAIIRNEVIGSLFTNMGIR